MGFSLIQNEGLLRLQNYHFYLFFLPGILSLMMVLLFLLIFFGFLFCGEIGGSARSQVDKISFRVVIANLLSFCLLMLRSSFLTYPILQTLYSIVFCWNESPFLKGYDRCYAGPHLVLASLGWASFGGLVLGIWYSHFLVFASDPFQRTPYGSFLSNDWVFGVVFKIVLPLFSILDHEV